MADALYFAVEARPDPARRRATSRCGPPDTRRCLPGPFIVAGNHSSLLDWVFVARFVERPIRFVLTREFYDQAGLTALYRRLGVIPIRDGAIELSAVRQLLATSAVAKSSASFPRGGSPLTARCCRRNQA